jgi:hypothetical protein
MHCSSWLHGNIRSCLYHKQVTLGAMEAAGSLGLLKCFAGTPGREKYLLSRPPCSLHFFLTLFGVYTHPYNLLVSNVSGGRGGGGIGEHWAVCDAVSEF